MHSFLRKQRHSMYIYNQSRYGWQMQNPIHTFVARPNHYIDHISWPDDIYKVSILLQRHTLYHQPLIRLSRTAHRYVSLFISEQENNPGRF